jgi:hypothetical protein
MTFAERFSSLLFDPDYATSDLYDKPAVGQGLQMVTLYATVSSFNALISAAIQTESFSFSLVTFFLSFVLAYVSWILISFVLHLVSEFLGGLGELPNAFAFTGLATAPLILTSIISMVVNIVGPELFNEDAADIVGVLRLGVNIIGLAWGWTGVLCYFGLKNAHRLHPMKALALTLLLFFAFVAIESADVL